MAPQLTAGPEAGWSAASFQTFSPGSGSGAGVGAGVGVGVGAGAGAGAGAWAQAAKGTATNVKIRPIITSFRFINYPFLYYSYLLTIIILYSCSYFFSLTPPVLEFIIRYSTLDQTCCADWVNIQNKNGKAPGFGSGTVSLSQESGEMKQQQVVPLTHSIS